jgi:hypothetical protein
MKRLCSAIVSVLIVAFAAVTASAQVGVPGLPQLPLPVPPLPDPVTGTLRTAQSLPRAELRRLRIRELLRTERDTVEADPDGEPILRRQLGALSPTPDALERARAAGFTILSEQSLDGLGLRLVVLQAPEGMSTRRALRRLRELDPDGSYDYNHLYLDSGVETSAQETPAAAASVPTPGPASAIRIGLIDTGVDARHPALAEAHMETHGCDGRPTPAFHGTAVASLLVGRSDEFEGMLPGATLYAADVFCGHGGGSLSLLAVELDWMARERVPVVNISLVGAKSVLLTTLVRVMGERGHLLVAAVGNDGPAAPPLFPAAYPEVVGVTGVDAKQRVLPEACRGEQVDFAARGADFRAAQIGAGFNAVRGTSFATPIVAGLLASAHGTLDPASAVRAIDDLAAGAADLGRQGIDTTYGRGLVGAPLRLGWE